MTVITVGVHIVDVLARPVESIPAGQETALVEQIRLTAAGSAAGTAVDLARLGLDVISMGAVGDDELGDFLIATMTRRGVDVTRLARRTTDQTAASILPIRPDGGRPSFHVPGANLTVTTADVDLALLKTAKAVHLGGPDVTFGLNDPAVFAALDEARSGGTLVTMDLLSEMEDLIQGALAFLPHVDYFLPNERQLFLATGIPETKQAAQWLLGENEGLRGVLATLGGEGSLVVTDSASLEVPAQAVEVVDTTGCGDAYCAGFIAGLVEGVGVETAARWGTAAAAAVATGLGSDAGDLSLDRLVTQI